MPARASAVHYDRNSTNPAAAATTKRAAVARKLHHSPRNFTRLLPTSLSPLYPLATSGPRIFLLALFRRLLTRVIPAKAEASVIHIVVIRDPRVDYQ